MHSESQSKMEERMRNETRTIRIRKEFDDINTSVSKGLDEYNFYKTQYTYYRYLHSRVKDEFSISESEDLLTHKLDIINNLLNDMDRLIKLSNEVEFTPGELEQFKGNVSNTIDIIKTEERLIKAEMEEIKNL